MPTIPFADDFLAGSLLSLLLPACLLIAIGVWFVYTITRIPKDTPESSLALPSDEILAAGAEAGIESAQAKPPAGED